MTENNAIRFRGKVAFWWYSLAAFIVVCTIGLVIWAVFGIFNSSPDAAVTAIGAITFVLLDIFMIDSCIRNYVDLKENSLEVRVSVFSETVSYSAISFIKETNSVWASLSTSLDRLQIRYGSYDDVLIAVKDKEGFLSEMQRLNPGIKIERIH